MNHLKLALLEIVRLKAETLKEQCQIRLIPDMGYTLFNIKGHLHIGYNMHEPEDSFFPEINIKTLAKPDGTHAASVQHYNPDQHYTYVDYFRHH